MPSLHERVALTPDATDQGTHQSPSSLEQDDEPRALPLPAPGFAETGRFDRPLSAPSPPGRGFEAARTALLVGLQQTLGNRAVQRYLQRATAAVAPHTYIARKAALPTSQRPQDVRKADTSGSMLWGQLSNAFGTFKFYISAVRQQTATIITPAGAPLGCNITLHFTPHAKSVDAAEIVFMQTAREQMDGKVAYLREDAAYWQPFDVGEGTTSDHTKGERNPFYGYDDKSQTSWTADAGTPGERSYVGSDATGFDTLLSDRPEMLYTPRPHSMSFESAPYALSGTDEGLFFGSFTWGFEIDATGTLALTEPQARDDVSVVFKTAIFQFAEVMSKKTWSTGTPRPVHLEFPRGGAATLVSNQQEQLKEVCAFMKTHPDARAWVGAQSNVGTDVAAQEQSALAAAHAIRDHLVARGVSAKHVHSLATQRVPPEVAGDNPFANAMKKYINDPHTFVVVEIINQ